MRTRRHLPPALSASCWPPGPRSSCSVLAADQRAVQPRDQAHAVLDAEVVTPSGLHYIDLRVGAGGRGRARQDRRGPLHRLAGATAPSSTPAATATAPSPSASAPATPSRAGTKGCVGMKVGGSASSPSRPSSASASRGSAAWCRRTPCSTTNSSCWECGKLPGLGGDGPRPMADWEEPMPEQQEDHDPVRPQVHRPPGRATARRPRPARPSTSTTPAGWRTAPSSTPASTAGSPSASPSAPARSSAAGTRASPA